MTEQRSALFPAIFINLLSIVFILVSLYVGYHSAKTLYYIQDSRNWPTVSGHVMSASVDRYWASRGDDFGQEYLPRIWFTYYIDDKNYVSDHVMFGQTWGRSLKEAEAMVAKYSAGSTVTVYHHPRDASLAVLDMSRVPPMECVRLGLSVLMLLCGGTALISTILRDFFE